MQWRRTSDLSERSLRPEPGQGPAEVDGNPVHLLRNTHDKCVSVDRLNRTESTASGLLKRKHAHRKCFHRENYTSETTNRHIIRQKRPELEVKTKIDGPKAETDWISRLPRSK